MGEHNLVREKLWIAAVICLTRRPFGCVFPIVVGMTNDLRIPASEAPSTATPAWLEPFVDLLPETVVFHVEVSGILVLLAIAVLIQWKPWK